MLDHTYILIEYYVDGSWGMVRTWTLYANYDCHVTTPSTETDHPYYVYIKLPVSPPGLQYGIFRWDLSALATASPPVTTVTQVRVKFNVIQAGGRNVDFSEILNDPVPAVAATLISDVDDGPIYVAAALVNGAWQTLGTTANATLLANIPLPLCFFALGMSFVDAPAPTTSYLARIKCTNPGSGAIPRPTLEVTTD